MFMQYNKNAVNLPYLVVVTLKSNQKLGLVAHTLEPRASMQWHKDCKSNLNTVKIGIKL